MTAAFLQSALASLITESKKKSNDVRHAAEKSLADLKSINVTSEIQLAGDLSRRHDFIEPFVLACHSKHGKLALSGCACLQRLVASHAVPRNRLDGVLKAYWEAVDVSYEVQLKILQTLPALLQLYRSDAHGDLLARVLDICATLSVSRTPLVASSAGATLDQLIESIFDEAESASNGKATPGEKAHAELNDKAASVDDACRLFKDFCAMLGRSVPGFLKTTSLPPLYLIRALEKILERHGSFVHDVPELVNACISQVLPALMQILSGKEDDFLLVAHCTRLTYVLLQKLSAHLVQEMIPVLKLFLSYADRDGGPYWKRALSLELFRGLLSSFGLLMRLYEPAKDETDNIIALLMATLVRTAAEDPSLIGMGRQSTMPAKRGTDARDEEVASIEVQGIGGGLASVSSADDGATGIGFDFSSLEQPLIDAEESAGPANVPKTYIYTLILESISALCEGLSKFIMPLSVARQHEAVPDDGEGGTEDGTADPTPQLKSKKRDATGRKYQRLANPLKMSQLPQLAQIQTCARMIEQCWPAILATSSTFLNAALDSHFYHVLIRSMQKLAQVSGTLELGTPRDALLTSLAKGSVPANASSIIAFLQPSTDSDGSDTEQEAADSLKSPNVGGPRQSTDIRKHSLNVRHLLCLRALLNLGIALGPTLGPEAWFIFIETLQQVEALMSISVRGIANPVASPNISEAADGQTTLASEMTAVNTASRRLFDSSRSYTDETFTALLTALYRLMGAIFIDAAVPSPLHTPTTNKSLSSPIAHGRGHRPSRSVSGLWMKTKALDIEVTFVLAKIKDIARINLHRFTVSTAVWKLIAARLLMISQDQDRSSRIRLDAAEILDSICMESVKLSDDRVSCQLVQSNSLDMLRAQMRPLPDTMESSSKQEQLLQVEIRRRVLEALEDILGHCGDSLEGNWGTVFATLEAGVSQDQDKSSISDLEITAASFRCIQLICNDFLELLRWNDLEALVAIMIHFAGQRDMNMALTTAALLRNITTLLQQRVDSLDISRVDGMATSPNDHEQNHDARSARLWVSAVQQLSRLCVDPRKDIRDASVRTLVQTLDAGGDLLTPGSWKILLEEAFTSLVRQYLSQMQNEEVEAISWEATCIYLTDATTKLIKDRISLISQDHDFFELWQMLLEVFKAEVQSGSLSMYAAGYRAIADLIEALSVCRVEHKRYVLAALEIWAACRIPMLDEPNQNAITAHASTLIAANTTSPDAVRAFSTEDQGVQVVVQDIIRTSVSGSRHLPYSNDVRQLSPDQEQLLSCVAVLRSILQDAVDDFADFLVALIESIPRRGVQESLKPEPRSGPRNSQTPTFVAFTSSLLTLLRQVIEGESTCMVRSNLERAILLLASIVATKYSAAPTSAIAPLWKEATITSTVLLETHPTQHLDKSTQTASVVDAIIQLVTAILGSGGMETKSPLPSPGTLQLDQEFDIEHFTRIQAASVPIFSLRSITEDTRKQYILTIFHASLLAKPWFGDFPDDKGLLSSPLKDVTTLRRGSVHTPVFAKRRKMVYAALDTLFDLVNPASSTFNHALAITAFPYLLLRIAHPIRTFLADQPLRGLTPLPTPQQVELDTILKKCLDLRCDDLAFEESRLSASSTDREDHERERSSSTNSSALAIRSKDVGNVTGDSEPPMTRQGARHIDGKSHLRALFPTILRLQKGWKRMMRLPPGTGAWQDEEEGRGIENSMEMWIESVSEGWGA